MKIFLKLASAFGGALSVWMELHFFYSMLSVLSKRFLGEIIFYQDTMLMPLDVSLLLLGLVLHYLIEEKGSVLLGEKAIGCQTR